MRYLLDTNILVYAYKNQGGCRAKLDAEDPSALSICAVTVVELERGIAKSQNSLALRLFLDDALARYPFFPLDAASASRAGHLRAQLERDGKAIGPYDLLIAGIALAHQLTVVTRNTSEFGRVPGLQVENWYE